MKLRNPFKKQESTDTDIHVIEMVHKEFETAGDRLLEEAAQFINASKILNEAKVKRLERAGFTATKEVRDARDIIRKKEISEQTAQIVEYYRVKYPCYKFITEEKIREICGKYGLIYGDIQKYTGFVPEKNLADIEQCHIAFEDARFMYWPGASAIVSNQFGIVPREIMIQMLDDAIKEKVKKERLYDFLFLTYNITADTKLSIAAPQKDFSISSQEMVYNFKITARPVPDPVVFASVAEGYLIITAWGKEASDPIVKNESDN